jgi:hypothetical protein
MTLAASHMHRKKLKCFSRQATAIDVRRGTSFTLSLVSFSHLKNFVFA